MKAVLMVHPQLAKICFNGQSSAEDHAVFDAHEAPTPVRLYDLCIEQLGQRNRAECSQRIGACIAQSPPQQTRSLSFVRCRQRPDGLRHCWQTPASQALVMPCAYATRWLSVPRSTTDGQKKAVETIIYYKNRLYCRWAEAANLDCAGERRYGHIPKTISHSPRGGRTAS